MHKYILRIIIEMSMRCTNFIGSHKRGLCTAGNRDLLMNIKGTDQGNNEPQSVVIVFGFGLVIHPY